MVLLRNTLHCVALCFLSVQACTTALTNFTLQGSPISDPSTTCTLVALSHALDLNFDNLDVAVAYFSGILLTDQLFCFLPSPSQPGIIEDGNERV